MKLETAQLRYQSGSGGLPSAGHRLRELDVLRFIAAAAVMVHHFTGVPTGAWGTDARILFPEVAPVTRFGHLGVELFFLISGFVILMSAWGRQIGDFAVSRVARLFPAYWLSVTLALVVYLIFGIHAGTTRDFGVVRSYLPNLTMLQEGVGVPKIEVIYWSLWLELHFYVLIAFLVRAGITYNRCLTFMIGWLLASSFSLEGDLGLVNMLLISGWAPYFVSGMSFFLIYRFGSNLIPWLIILACWALATNFSVERVRPPFNYPGVEEYVTPVIITVMFLVMGLVATHRLSWVRWRGFTVLGVLTYPLYLLHETVSRPLIKWLYPEQGRWVVLGVATAAVVAASYATYRLVDRPGNRWLGRRLRLALAQARAHSALPGPGSEGGAEAFRTFVAPETVGKQVNGSDRAQSAALEDR